MPNIITDKLRLFYSVSGKIKLQIESNGFSIDSADENSKPKAETYVLKTTKCVSLELFSLFMNCANNEKRVHSDTL